MQPWATGQQQQFHGSTFLESTKVRAKTPPSKAFEKSHLPRVRAPSCFPGASKLLARMQLSHVSGPPRGEGSASGFLVLSRYSTGAKDGLRLGR